MNAFVFFYGLAMLFGVLTALAWGAAGGLLFAVVAKGETDVHGAPRYSTLEVALTASTGVLLFEGFGAVAACVVAWIFA